MNYDSVSQQHFNTTHGMTKTITYSSWRSMRSRCNNPKDASYARYGGAGVYVCERWSSFECFLEDMGERPSLEHSLDRIDNSKGYEPNNCRWASILQQHNNRGDNRVLEFNGESLTLAEWARKLGVNRLTIVGRLNLGWPVERALTEPLHAEKRRNA